MQSSQHQYRSKARSAQSQAGPSSPSTTRTVRTADESTCATAKDRINKIHSRTTRMDEQELALRRKLVPRLAKRAYHLEEGNSWCQDWIQYQKNTHPVFGCFMYHRFHPVRLPQRIIILVGSVAVGFAITNIVYLGFLEHESVGRTVNFVYDATGKVVEVQQKFTHIELEQSLVFLLTVGSFFHSMFDMMIWYLMACFCFRPGGMCQIKEGRGGAICQNFGIYAAVLVVMLAVVIATGLAIARFTEDEKRRAEYEASLAEHYAEDQLDGSGSHEADESTNKYAFIVGYFLELVVALFVFYFFTSTVFFSGILGCGRVPVLGGRPYELRKLKSKELGNDDDQSAESEEEGCGMRAYTV